MKKQISKLTKILLILLIIISQTFLPISVFAEELLEEQLTTELEETSTESEEEITTELEETSTEIEEISTEIEEEITTETEEITNDNYKVFINEQELTEDNFNIEENSIKKITIVGEYEGEGTYTFTPNQTMEIDFTNRLYGNYSYELSVYNELELLDTKNITINHVGDNNNIINVNNIYYQNNTYYILGDLTEHLTVEDIINKFNNDLSIYNATLEVVDNDNNKLLNTDIVETGYKLNLKASYIDYEITNEVNEYYTLSIVGDINEDEVIDNNDLQKVLIEEILNNQSEETTSSVNILDITNILLSEIKEESIDNLTTTFEYNSNYFLDEEVSFNYYIEGFDQEVLKGIEGNITYDKNILELTSIEINSIAGGYNEDGHFIYLLDDYNEDGLLITFKFKPLSVGSTTIVLEDVIGSTGAKTKALLDTDTFEGEINILEYGKGGDVEPEEETPPPEDSTEEPSQEEVITVYRPATTYVKPVLLSGDNYIKSLTIKGYELKFNKDTLEYELYVKNDVNSLDMNIELNDSTARYEVTGNESFKTGENTVEIIVTAENNNQKTYTIKVNKEAKEVIEEEVEESKSSSKGIIIFLIILVIIGLVYVIFKDDDEDKK